MKYQRQRILRASARLFRKNGFDGTTMDEVAAAVKLNKGTLYHYFPGKSEILFSIFEDSIERARLLLPRLAESNPEESIRLFFRHQLASVRANPNEAAVYFQESRYADRYFTAKQREAVRQGELEINGALRTSIESGVAAGVFRAVKASSVVQAMVGTCAWISSSWSPRSSVSLDELAEEYSVLFLRGLRVESSSAAADSSP